MSTAIKIEKDNYCMDIHNHGTTLYIPRGIPNLAPIYLDMTLIYEAESRLNEISFIKSETAAELMGYFNNVCNLATKYLAWVEYELLTAKKYYEIARSVVILEKAPEEFKKTKDSGIKFNEDFREALVARDAECQKMLDIINILSATRTLLENKAKSFERAYYAARHIFDRKSLIAAVPNFETRLGETYYNDLLNDLNKGDKNV